LVIKRDGYRGPTGKEAMNGALCPIGGAMNTDAVDQQMEFLRKLLGERASLYELAGNWRKMERLLSIFA
jgi:hypothetical protein